MDSMYVFPALSLFLCGCGMTLWFFENSYHSSKVLEGNPGSCTNTALVSLCIAVSALALVMVPYTGFLLSSCLVLLITMVLLKERRITILTLVCLAWSVVVWGIFEIALQVPLPRGSLFS